jgi:glucokinase
MFAFPALIADIGGTNARFALVTKAGERPTGTVRLRTGDFADLTEAVRAALSEGDLPRPASVLVAAAGPVADRRCRLTNAGSPGRRFLIDGPATLADLGLGDGLLLNDFEALSVALPALGPADMLTAGGGVFVAGAPRVVVGAGTGLGVGALVRSDGRWLPLASEGGHVSLALDGLAARGLRQALGPESARLSAEDLLSGRGLARLAAAAAERLRIEIAPRSAEAVTQQALARSDATAVEAVEAMLELAGAFAGDAALMFGATGGVYVAGGILPRFADRFRESRFREAFEAKTPMRDYLGGIGTALVTADDAALVGLAALVASPADYALDYAARRWAAG